MKASRQAGPARKQSLAILLALAAGAVQAQTQTQPQPAEAIPTVDPADPLVQKPAPDSRPYKSYGAAALEILAFQAVLNRVDHAFVKPDDYGISIGSIRRNLRSSWGEDRDP